MKRITVTVLENQENHPNYTVHVEVDIGNRTIEGPADYNANTRHYQFHNSNNTATISHLRNTDQALIRNKIGEVVDEFIQNQ